MTNDHFHGHFPIICLLNSMVKKIWEQQPDIVISESVQGKKILKLSTHPTCPYVFVNSIIYIGNSQNFYSSIPSWPADKWIFSSPAVCYK